MKTIAYLIILVFIVLGATILAFDYIDTKVQVRRNTEICTQEKKQVPQITVTGHSTTVISTKAEVLLVEGER